MKKLLYVPFFLGISLIAYSWFISYPVTNISANNPIISHVSIVYWFSLPLTLASALVIAATSKNQNLKWVMTVSIVLLIYSLSYFFYRLPGSDSTYFRGLTESFMNTNNLNPFTYSRYYFQWPSFFLLSDITVTISGLELANVEFLFYTILGFLMATALYVNASKVFRKGGFLAVVAFFMALFYFLNFQYVPFSLAFALLLILIMLESDQSNYSIPIKLVLFAGLTFTHAVVALFFVLYLLMRRILDKKQQGHLFLLTLVTYFLIQLYQASLWFETTIVNLITFRSEYSVVAENILSPASSPIDTVAQMFSRAVTIVTVLVCLSGFALLLVRRKMRNLDKALFLTGTLFSVLGIVVYYVGLRALPIAFIAISLGISYLFESKYEKHLKYLFLVLAISFIFIPLHNSFDGSAILYQTEEELFMSRFTLEYYNWNPQRKLLSYHGTKWYLLPHLNYTAYTFDSQTSNQFYNLSGKQYDTIMYSERLGSSFSAYGIEPQNVTEFILMNYNTIYDSGEYFIAEKTPSAGE